MSSEEQPIKERIKKLEEENSELRERLLYLQAEIENMRKLMEREMERARLGAVEKVMRRFITIYEDLRRAVESLPSTDNPFVLADGLRLILRQVESLLESEGVKRMEVVGKPFDPFMYEAVAFEEREDAEDGVVVEEIEPGYMLADRLLKTPKVKVARKRRDGT